MKRFYAFYKSLNMAQMLTFWIGLLFFVFSTAFGYFVFAILEESKLKDEFAIQFLEMERLSGKIQSDLALHNEGVNFAAKKEIVEKYFRDNPFDSIYIHNDNGELSLHIKNSNGIRSYSLNAQLFFGKYFSEKNEQNISTAFILDRSSQLVFSNNEELTANNIIKRPLVVNFIKDPLSQNMYDISDQYSKMIGFYKIIPKTNLIMFFESDKNVILKKITHLKLRSMLTWGFVFAIGLALLQIPLRKTSLSLRELIENSHRIAKGDFKTKLKHKSFGELQTLSESFKVLGHSLIERDENIKKLMAENQEKVRLEGELAITNNIQNSFLPPLFNFKSKKLKISSAFIPAAEAAGDWFNYFYDEVNQQTLIAIADVSGHGAGSAMFTAVIGGMFEDFKLNYSADSDLTEFLKRLGGVIYKLGKGQWHATMILIRFAEQEQQFELVGAGHVPLMMFNHSLDQGTEAKTLPLPSEPLGMSEQPQVCQKFLQAKKGLQLVLYTDGLTEAVNEKGKAFGAKGLKKTLNAISGHDVKETTHLIQKSWYEHIRHQKAGDDTCIVGIEVA